MRASYIPALVLDVQKLNCLPRVCRLIGETDPRKIIIQQMDKCWSRDKPRQELYQGWGRQGWWTDAAVEQRKLHKEVLSMQNLISTRPALQKGF